MKRIVNPIAYNDLEPEIQLRLVRYIAKLERQTACHWKIKYVYKPTTWYRARLTSREGSELILWYRPKRRCWTVINTYFGFGIYRRSRRGPSLLDEKTLKPTREALRLAKTPNNRRGS